MRRLGACTRCEGWQKVFGAHAAKAARVRAAAGSAKASKPHHLKMYLDVHVNAAQMGCHVEHGPPGRRSTQKMIMVSGEDAMRGRVRRVKGEEKKIKTKKIINNTRQ